MAGEDGPTLLSRNWLQSLRLDWGAIFAVKDTNLKLVLEKNSQIFDSGLGTLKGFQAKLFV